MRGLARWAFRHRWTVVVLWLVALVGVQAVAAVTGSGYSDDFQPPGTDSTRAQQMLEAAAPSAAGDTSRVVFAADGGRLTDPDREARVERTLRSVARLPHVAEVSSPFSSEGGGQLSADARTAYATIQFDQLAKDLPGDAVDRVVDTARAHAGGGLRIELGGEAISRRADPSLGGVGFGLAAAGVVLLLAFGSLVAMGLPLATAVISVGTSLGLLDIVSHLVVMPTFTTQLATLIGLGVGIDYAMFILSRYRAGLLRRDSPEAATITAVDTSGRAVLFAGVTVCIALLGMLVLGISVFNGVAVGASIAVAVTVAAALTLQPALLGIAGTRVLSRRTRRRAGQERSGATSGRQRGVALLQRRPRVQALLGVAVIVVLALPFLSLRLGFSDAGNEPTANTSRRAFDLIAAGFGPGANGPLVVVAPRTGPQAEAAFRRVLADLADASGVARVSAPVVVGTGSDAVETAQLVPTTAPQDEATAVLLAHLRDDVVPRATAGTGLMVRIGGITAVNEDFSHTIAQRMVLFIGLVLALSFLLLVAVFRSLLVALLAVVMNLLSVAAAFGVVTAVFVKGWGNGLIGLESTGPVEPFIPVIVFSILFGLSMDYEVFLVSRMHELWRSTGDHRLAVSRGLAETGQVITAAAAIMICVFAAFILGDNRVIKLFGLGLASAVLIDAFLVRTLIMPAVMLLLGPVTWAVPRRLDRLLPRIPREIEDLSVAPDPRAADPAGISTGGS